MLTNDVIEDGKVAMQLNVVIVGDVRTRPTILHVMGCYDLYRQSHRRWMMLRYQSTMLNSDQLY